LVAGSSAARPTSFSLVDGYVRTTGALRDTRFTGVLPAISGRVARRAFRQKGGARCDDAKVDPAWIGAISALGGALVGATPPTITAVVQRSNARDQRAHELALKLRTRRDELLAEWHEGLAAAHNAYHQWIVHLNRPGAEKSEFLNPDIPDAVGTAWFEKLRPYISETGDAADYRYASSVHCEEGVVVVLSLEIARIERQWLAEVTH
jgi:hypothetical protein